MGVLRVAPVHLIPAPLPASPRWGEETRVYPPLGGGDESMSPAGGGDESVTRAGGLCITHNWCQPRAYQRV
ncbi:MAG: hypothetical protein KatS3mg056_0539 [Chloroflexus sp.]|nr:MAG: hypothetical protein KatS3mg056_0539 [Chloroflexus sp.]